MTDAEIEIRAILSSARMDAIAGAVVASAMPLPEVRRLALNVTAWVDLAQETGAAPDMSAALANVPANVREGARAIVFAALAEAIEHRVPGGPAN